MASIRKRTWKKGGETRNAFVVDWLDAAGVRHRKQFAKKKEADAFRVETENLMRTGLFRAGGHKTTVSDVAGEFLKHCEERHQRGERMTYETLKGYKTHVKVYILAGPASPTPRKGSRAMHFIQGIGALKIAQVTTSQVHHFKDRVRNAGVSVATTRHILATLHALLEFAKSRDIIASNPATRIRVIGRRDEGSKRVEPPSKELVDALLQIAKPKMYVMILFAASTGVRAGEQRALRWRHIDFEACKLTVETRVDSRGQEDGQGTKTAAGIREIPISASLLTALKDWRLASPFSADSDLIFPNEVGSYLDHNNFRRRCLYPLLDQLAEMHRQHHPSVPFKRCKWHALRHFAISTWIERGFPIKAIQEYAGHSSVQMTMDRYGHLFPSDDYSKMMDDIGLALVTKKAQKKEGDP